MQPLRHISHALQETDEVVVRRDRAARVRRGRIRRPAGFRRTTPLSARAFSVTDVYSIQNLRPFARSFIYYSAKMGDNKAYMQAVRALYRSVGVTDLHPCGSSTIEDGVATRVAAMQSAAVSKEWLPVEQVYPVCFHRDGRFVVVETARDDYRVAPVNASLAPNVDEKAGAVGDEIGVDGVSISVVGEGNIATISVPQRYDPLGVSARRFLDATDVAKAVHASGMVVGSS